ncbi:MAG: phage holin family protein [Firmicutes bacterium]|nr:phage holin family protein [Bacillota bacterium]
MIKKILLGIVLNGLALFVVAKLLSDLQYTGGFMFFLIGGVIIGVLNTFVKPLMKLLSFPVVMLTAGLFSFVINVIIFWLTVKVVNGIHFSDVTVTVGSVWTYFIAALIFGIINWVLHILVPNK